ncbi:ubiquitin-conjugating enzyme E2-24 kDa isoform X2 [Drosophila montana]|uniref:ubiquitin-conjugating enzyme E2-24 kDa isoform X2 n=1 Tax=Drosophila montana TaxID=40370 RepID=UPI00313B6BEF
MSNLSNVAPQKAKGSTTETMTVEEPSATMAAISLPAGDEANKDENAPSTSQGQQRGACSSATHTTSTTTTISTNNNNSSDSNDNNRMGSATPMTQLNGPVMRIKRELNEIIENPPPNCSAEMYKEDLFHWKAIIMGPSGTPYEGGIFKLDIRFPVVASFASMC